jgi:uncharacterized protein (DUF305 family)
VNRTLHKAIFATSIFAGACAARTTSPVPAPRNEAVTAPEVHQHTMQLPATAGPGFTVADVRFMQDMIGHHAQAIVMAALAPSHGASSKVLQLAQKIDISLRDEIEMMKQWLRDRQQQVPDDAHLHMMRMPGMLTPEQMTQLGAARGRDFDRLFLTFMIQHHEGALSMVETLFAAPGAGQDSDIFRFATDVDADQRDEIFVMRTLLDTLDTTRGELP